MGNKQPSYKTEYTIVDGVEYHHYLTKKVLKDGYEVCIQYLNATSESGKGHIRQRLTTSSRSHRRYQMYYDPKTNKWYKHGEAFYCDYESLRYQCYTWGQKDGLGLEWNNIKAEPYRKLIARMNMKHEEIMAKLKSSLITDLYRQHGGGYYTICQFSRGLLEGPSYTFNVDKPSTPRLDEFRVYHRGERCPLPEWSKEYQKVEELIDSHINNSQLSRMIMNYYSLPVPKLYIEELL